MIIIFSLGQFFDSLSLLISLKYINGDNGKEAKRKMGNNKLHNFIIRCDWGKAKWICVKECVTSLLRALYSTKTKDMFERQKARNLRKERETETMEEEMRNGVIEWE